MKLHELRPGHFFSFDEDIKTMHKRRVPVYFLFKQLSGLSFIKIDKDTTQNWCHPKYIHGFRNLEVRKVNATFEPELEYRFLSAEDVIAPGDEVSGDSIVWQRSANVGRLVGEVMKCGLLRYRRRI